MAAQELGAALQARRLTDRQAVQRGRRILVVPGEKPRTFARQVWARTKVILVPETVGPQAVYSFDEVVALRLTRRNENHFNAQLQSQANDFPEHASGASQTSKSGIIVEVQKIRQPQGGKGTEQMVRDRSRCLIRADGLRTS